MLRRLIHPCEEVLLTGKMLIMFIMFIMFIMLIQNGDSWGNPEMDLTLLTLLTSPLPEACFAPHGENVNNVNNVKTILSEK